MVRSVIAFDIGGTSIRAAVVSGKRITQFEQVPTPKGKKAFLSQVESMIDARLKPSTAGIGIAFPGQIKNGRVSRAPNLVVNNFNLESYLVRKYKKKVKVHNDAGCVALAEAKFGCKKKNFFVITLGTGIGGGLVIDGKEFRGTGLGAEFGHILINGMFLESLWQSTRREIFKKFKTRLMSDLINNKALNSNKIVDQTADYLGQGIASLITALDPEVVVLAGGVRECGKKLLVPIKKSVADYSFLTKKTPIVWSSLKEPGVLGASLLV